MWHCKGTPVNTLQLCLCPPTQTTWLDMYLVTFARLSVHLSVHPSIPLPCLYCLACCSCCCCRCLTDLYSYFFCLLYCLLLFHHMSDPFLLLWHHFIITPDTINFLHYKYPHPSGVMIFLILSFSCLITRTYAYHNDTEPFPHSLCAAFYMLHPVLCLTLFHALSFHILYVRIPCCYSMVAYYIY